jgi:hypothetical protein
MKPVSALCNRLSHAFQGAGGKGLRQRLLKAILGTFQWSKEGKAELASVLLITSSTKFLAQLGYLAMVR